MFTTRTRGRAAGGAALAVLTALSLAACGNKSDEGTTAAESCVDTSGDTIKLGFLNSTSGAMSISEQTVRDSLGLAMEEINADGGILGKQIEAVEEDGTVELSDGDGESTSWQVFGDEGGDTAYVRVGEQRRDPFVTIVYGSAPDEQLRGVVGSLLTRG